MQGHGRFFLVLTLVASAACSSSSSNEAAAPTIGCIRDGDSCFCIYNPKPGSLTPVESCTPDFPFPGATCCGDFGWPAKGGTCGCFQHSDGKCTATETQVASCKGEGGGGGTACTSGVVSCSNGELSACEDGVMKTAGCEEQCTADGFTPASGCSPKFPGRCACGGGLTDSVCETGINALCTCLDTSPGCQGVAILENYARCHRDPTSETAQVIKCFGKYMSGGSVACTSAIMACGSSTPSSGCTADADCGHCERCELSTGKCLTKLACK